MAPPIAAMITSYLRASSRSYPLAHRSHDDPILAEEVEEVEEVAAPEVAPEPDEGSAAEPARPDTD